MSFLEFYNSMQETKEEFYVGKILVTLTEVSDDTFDLLAEATNTISNPKSLKTLGDQSKMKKWRVTYNVNGKEVTNYLTAQNKLEAKRMLFDYLSMGSDQDKVHVVQSSEFAPVDNWNELVKLLQYSLQNDRKKRGTDTEPFGSIDNADFHLMLDLVQKNPNFVQKQLASLPQDLQFYFKKAYNALSRRDLDQDLGSTKKGSYWGNQVKDLVGNFGDSIKKKLAAVKTRNSPAAATPEPTAPMTPQLAQSSPEAPSDDYEERDPRIAGRLPIANRTTHQARLPFWR